MARRSAPDAPAFVTDLSLAAGLLPPELNLSPPALSQHQAMSAKSTSPAKTVIIAALAALPVALYFGWQWASMDSAPPPTLKEAVKAEAAGPVKAVEAPAGDAARPAAAMPAGGGADKLYTVEEGDLMIDEILRSTKEIPEMARDLHELVKKLNGEAQVNASRHLVNLTSDQDYGLIAGFLTDAKMNPDVIEVLFSDLMNRNRVLQMPLFMTILKNPAHPQNEQVRNVLTILSGEDHGTDWSKWDAWAAAEIRREQTGQ